MSHFCPLCGKNKPEETFFCESCSRKIKNEYEVDIPDKKQQSETPIVPAASVEKSKDENVAEVAHQEINISQPKPAKKRKTRTIFLGILIAVLLLVSGFYFYQEVVRNSNLERSRWEASLKENTISGYLAYMDDFPNGKHYALAQDNLMKLKEQESAEWENMRHTDNATQLRDFMKNYPESPYTPLVKARLDSLTWAATLSENSAEGYSNYMMLSQSGEFKGDYFAEAEKRYEMLFQSYPVNEGELDSIRTVVDGIYTALSTVNYARITQFLAPTVNRFFDSGAAPRERIAGELSVAGAKTQAGTIKFKPNLEAVRYEKTFQNTFKANVPLVKTFIKDGTTRETTGYIVHLELNPDYKITAIFETKPSVDAP